MAVVPILDHVCSKHLRNLASDACERGFPEIRSQSQESVQIMELVGRCTAVDQWSASCAVACYRASNEFRSVLFSEERSILDELYERIEGNTAEDEKLHDVMKFWGRL